MINVKIVYPEHTKEERIEFLEEEAERMRAFPTEGEQRFMDFCNKQGIEYTFQKPVLVCYKGFILDFEIITKNNTRYKGSKKRKIVVEIDGGYHNTPEQKVKDAARTRTLRGAAYKVLRLTNEETKNPNIILNKLVEFLKKIHETELYTKLIEKPSKTLEY